MFFKIKKIDKSNKRTRDAPSSGNNNRAAGYTEVIQNLNGTTDLINLIKTIDEQKRVYNDVPIRIGFIGKSKVGKSTLINILLEA